MTQTQEIGSLQPRRYQVRQLRDSEKLSEREIADRLGVSQKTVNRDLSETVAPAGHTEAGTPFYPPGRFDLDPDYQERVVTLRREMPERNARLQAAREFSGAANPSKTDELRSSASQVELREQAIKAARAVS